MKVFNFLNGFRSGKGEPFTYTSKEPKGSFYVEEPEDIQKFFSHYNRAVKKGETLAITEKPQLIGPLRVDFDFKMILEKNLERKYTKVLKRVIKMYQEEIKRLVDPNSFEENLLYVLVLEKSNPRKEKDHIKDGFHLHFPHFICETWCIEYLRDKVSERCSKEGIWKHMSLVESEDNVIDHNIGRKVWMLYGSTNIKPNCKEPYLFTKAYDEKCGSIGLKYVFEIELEGRDKKSTYYLPELLTIRGYDEPIELNDLGKLEKETVTKKRKKVKKRIIRKKPLEKILQDLKVIKDGEIMDMISPNRAEGYDEWMDVGWTLFNIGQGHEDALELWIEFSKQSSKFEEGQCEDIWYNMKLSSKTIASLIFMAKNDSPKLYYEWKKTNIRQLIFKSIKYKRNEYDVAMVVCQMYKDRFVCANAKKDVWFEFEGHRWRQLDDIMTLRKLLPTEVIEEFDAVEREIQDLKSTNPEEREKYEGQQKKIWDIVHHLKTDAFQNKVIKMCRHHMHNPHFIKKLDTNSRYLGMENGVWDFELNFFREGRPDDYISFSTGIDYQEFDMKDPEVKEMLNFFFRVFVNDNLRKYFFKLIRYLAKGKNPDKKFIISLGDGDNSKSISWGFIETCFGDYWHKAPPQMFMKGNNERITSNSQRSDLTDTYGKRVIMIDEFTDDIQLDYGIIKKFTGSDSLHGRFFNSAETVKFKPMFTLMLQTNEIPGIPGHDQPTWNRTRFLNFESNFPEMNSDVPATWKEQVIQKIFPRDRKISQTMERMKGPIWWYVLTQIKDDPDGLYEPDEVKFSTSQYRKTQDVYLQFINDRLEKNEPDEAEGAEGAKVQEGYIKLMDVYSEFKEFYKENYPSYRDIPGKEKMKRELSKKAKLGPIGAKSRWVGYKFIEEEDSEEEDMYAKN